MNFNNLLFSKPTGRARIIRGRTNNVVNVQRPLNKVSRKKSVANTSSTSSSSLRWADRSTRNSSTLQKTTDSSKTHSTSESDTRIILAISEGRGEATCEIGIAAIDVSKPHLILCQISDSSSYVNTLTKINILNPDEILVPLTFVNNSSANRLLGKIKEQFKDCAITAVARSTFNRITGIQYIKQLCAPEWDSIVIPLQHKYYSLTAVAALMNYTETMLHIVYANNSLKVEYQESEGCAIIDVTTADKLELVASVNPLAINNRYSSLFGILNFCQTRIGARTLRATILQPPCSVPDIESRLECVTALRRNPYLMANLQNTLSKLKNIDQLLTLVNISADSHENCSARQLNYVLTLKSVLDLIQPLKEILEETPEPFFQELNQTLSHKDFEVMRRLIKMMINPDARPAKGEQGVHQRCFAIKPGLNGLLDIIRKAYSERIDDMREYVKSLGQKYNMGLTLANTNKKGYHIVMTLNKQTKRSFKKSDLPPEFIQVDRLPSSVTMKTDEILNLSVRIENLLVEILKMNNIMIHQLLLELRAFMGLFFKLCEDVAKLDMLQSLAQASNNLNYVKPEFNDFMELTDARHPLLDFLCRAPPTPNSILVSKDHNLHIITGPNSSGKSILIRQILLLQVMAQVGSYVPATKAVFRVCDRILARVHFDDNLECNASSFVLEVKEIQYFRTVMTENTLIIIDELCRSTAVGEGTAMAVALCEDLAKSNAYIFMATHYIFTTKMADIYANIKNWQMETIESGVGDARKLKFTYTLLPGVTKTKRYGLFAAETSWSSSIVDEAKQTFGRIHHSSLSTGTVQPPIAVKLKYDLEADLRMLKLKGELNLTSLNEKLLQYMEDLKSLGYPVQIHQTQEESHVADLADINLSPIEHKENRFKASPQNSMIIYPEVVYSEDSQLSAEVSQMFNNMIKQNKSIDAEVVSTQNTINSYLIQDNLKEEANFQRPASPNPSQITFSGLPFEKTIHCSILSTPRNVEVTDPDVALALDDLETCSEYFTTAEEDWDIQKSRDRSDVDDIIDGSVDENRPKDSSDASGSTPEKQETIDQKTPNNFSSLHIGSSPQNHKTKPHISPPKHQTIDQNIPESLDSSDVASQANQCGEKHILVHSVHIFDRDNRLVDIQIHQPPTTNRNPPVEEAVPLVIPQRQEVELQSGEFKMSLKKTLRTSFKTKRRKRASSKSGQSSSGGSGGKFNFSLKKRTLNFNPFGDGHQKKDERRFESVSDASLNLSGQNLVFGIKTSHAAREDEMNQSILNKMGQAPSVESVKEKENALPKEGDKLSLKKTLGIRRKKSFDHGIDIDNPSPIKKHQTSSVKLGKEEEGEILKSGLKFSLEANLSGAIPSDHSKEDIRGRSQTHPVSKPAEAKRHFTQFLRRPHSDQRKQGGFLNSGSTISDQKPTPTTKLEQTSLMGIDKRTEDKYHKDGIKFSWERNLSGTLPSGQSKENTRPNSQDHQVSKTPAAKRHVSPFLRRPDDRSGKTKEDQVEFKGFDQKLTPVDKIEQAGSDQIEEDENQNGTDGRLECPSLENPKIKQENLSQSSKRSSDDIFDFSEAKSSRKVRFLRESTIELFEFKGLSSDKAKTKTPKRDSSQILTNSSDDIFSTACPKLPLEDSISKSIDLFEVTQTQQNRSNIFETSYHSDVFRSLEDEKSNSTSAKDSTGDLFISAPVIPAKRRRGNFKTPLKTKPVQASPKIMLNVFKPPKPLTKKEIVDDYQRQMQKCLDNTQDAETIEKNLKTLMNRPSVDQLRQQTYLAKIRKTEEGIVIMPAAKTQTKPRAQKVLKKKVSSEFGKSFLSDKNSAKFEECLQDKSDDSFKFFFDRGDVGLDLFRASGVQPVSASQNTLFDNSGSDSKTPDGYFKQHKATISSMLNKYL